MTLSPLEPGTVRAQELYGDYWFNSDPVPVQAQRGGVILLSFWDYTCSASLRISPYCVDWDAKYAPAGLVTVGVHTPRFPFGKEPENIQRAIQREGIRYPVVMDNESLIWSRYGVRSWPTQLLVDRNGFVRFANTGGGTPGAFEHALQSLLVEAGMLEEIPELTDPLREIDRPGAICYRATPEIYPGYVRGGIGNAEGVFPESDVLYADPEIYVEGRCYVVGEWLSGRERVEYEGDGGGGIVCRYSAREVDAVLSVAKGGITLEVLQDGAPLPADRCGEDVARSRAGRTTVAIKEPRAYHLVKNPEHGDHVLTLGIPRGGKISLYSLAFVPGVIPELISR
jgi:hypothetical protein